MSLFQLNQRAAHYSKVAREELGPDSDSRTADAAVDEVARAAPSAGVSSSPQATVPPPPLSDIRQMFNPETVKAAEPETVEGEVVDTAAEAEADESEGHPDTIVFERVMPFSSKTYRSEVPFESMLRMPLKSRPEIPVFEGVHVTEDDVLKAQEQSNPPVILFSSSQGGLPVRTMLSGIVHLPAFNMMLAVAHNNAVDKMAEIQQFVKAMEEKKKNKK